MVQNDLFYSKEAVVYPVISDRPMHNKDDTTQITNDNIDDGIAKFGEQIINKYVYRIPLKYLHDVGKINF